VEAFGRPCRIWFNMPETAPDDPEVYPLVHLYGGYDELGMDAREEVQEFQLGVGVVHEADPVATEVPVNVRGATVQVLTIVDEGLFVAEALRDQVWRALYRSLGSAVSVAGKGSYQTEGGTAFVALSSVRIATPPSTRRGPGRA
jgi:hypothetical protein